MCGRYALAHPRRLAESGLLDQLAVAAVAPDVPAELPPRHNIAPSQPVLAALNAPVPRAEGGAEGRVDVRATRRTLALLRWGLVPRWAKEASIGHRLANARAETIATAPAFRDAWARGRRCAVLADAFYEWQDVRDATADPRNGDPGTTGRRPVARAAKPRKQPWALRLAGGAPFAFAGLWERWRDPADPEAAPLVTCTLVTTAPNALVASIHDRMPVILAGDALTAWLDGSVDADAAAALLAPYPAEAMEAWRVSMRVNTPANDDPGVLAPVAAPA
jgi:putative SOS response-associated peptidase YedK